MRPTAIQPPPTPALEPRRGGAAPPGFHGEPAAELAKTKSVEAEAAAAAKPVEPKPSAPAPSALDIYPVKGATLNILV